MTESPPTDPTEQELEEMFGGKAGPIIRTTEEEAELGRAVEYIERIDALVEAAWQVLDDMDQKGHCCCPAAKAQLRIAMEPYLTQDMPLSWPLEKAQAIIKERNAHAE